MSDPTYPGVIMKVLLFGASGQVGSAFRSVAPAHMVVDAPTSGTVSLRDASAVQEYIRDTRPNVIVNTAAFTKVDDAETAHDDAFAINATAPGVMAEAGRTIGARFIHLSTDYVFDGHGDLPYSTTAPTHPLNVYGASKLGGEQAVAVADPTAAIVRTSWVHSGSGVNFVATAVRVLGAGKSMRVVDDQVGAPTRASTLAHACLRLIEQRDIAGLLHVTDAGVASWYDVACCVRDTMHSAGRVPDDALISPVDSSAFPRAARRPQVSILATHETRARMGWTPPHWRDGVIASTQELLHA